FMEAAGLSAFEAGGFAVFEAGGFAAISRGLSAATPPEPETEALGFDPGRGRSAGADSAGTPAGVHVVDDSLPGVSSLALLDPRLMAATPPGSEPVAVKQDLSRG